jgi:hypothetical protein
MENENNNVNDVPVKYHSPAEHLAVTLVIQR